MGTRALSRLAAGSIAFWMGASAFGAELRIIAPAAPGSSWDQLAKLVAAGVGALPDPRGASVTNVPGGSGTVGLLQFATSATRDELLVVGLTMMDAALVNRSPVTVDQLTPIARLSTESFALAVPAASPIRDVADLRTAFAADPGKVSLAGGPLGGVDHAAAIELVRALALMPRDLRYVAFLSSAEAVAALAEEKVTASLLALGELQGEIAAGRLRLIGVAAAGRLASDPTVPTLVEVGIPLRFANWRGLVGKAGLSRVERDELSALVERAVDSPAWREALARKKWVGAYLPGDGFADFIRTEQARLKDTLRSAGLLKRGEN